MIIRMILTIAGAVFGFIIGGVVSVFFAAKMATPTDDVPPFGGIIFGAFFGLALGSLLVQIPYSRRQKP